MLQAEKAKSLRPLKFFLLFSLSTWSLLVDVLVHIEEIEKSFQKKNIKKPHCFASLKEKKSFQNKLTCQAFQIETKYPFLDFDCVA